MIFNLRGQCFLVTLIVIYMKLIKLNLLLRLIIFTIFFLKCLDFGFGRRYHRNFLLNFLWKSELYFFQESGL